MTFHCLVVTNELLLESGASEDDLDTLRNYHQRSNFPFRRNFKLKFMTIGCLYLGEEMLITFEGC